MDIEPRKKRKTRGSRGPSWKQLENRLLYDAWIAISLDPIFIA
jgi:hypothetical protein